MRLLLLLFMFFFGMVSAAPAEKIPSNTKDMLHLTVNATNVRLRAGAGTEFEILGMASRGDADNSCYIADSRTVMDSTGRPWFKLIANVYHQSDLAIDELDRHCWIRSDFVKTRALRDGEAMVADSTFFRILHISFKSMSGTAAFTLKEPLPVCAKEDDCYFAEGTPATDIALPAGETFYLWSMPSKGSTGNVCISVWKQIAPNRIKLAGTMPRHVLDSFDFGSDQKAVERWKTQQPAYYWE